ncbi:MAG: SDR family NAD(P)-dependent oxidoreductase [Flavobacteriales bacterium]|nr:SDR family NAD(P)-dependent oxidoreductase [Flavobacteriales bacterium]
MKKSKTILITGSTKGIGFEIARQLLDLGHNVIISGRDEERLLLAASKLTTFSEQLETLLMDVSKQESIESAADQFQKSIDVLINNAAILLKEDHSIHKQSNDILFQTLQTNGYGSLNVSRAFLRHINSPGRIINISSGGGSMSDPVGGWAPAYCVSKSLLNAFTRQLANELIDENIAVNAVCPGWVKTDMGGSGASRSAEHGAATPVWLAVEADQLLTGNFFRDKKEIPW